jgi:hypothetical protein
MVPCCRDVWTKTPTAICSTSAFAASAFSRELSIVVNLVREALECQTAEHGPRRVPMDRFTFAIYYRAISEQRVIAAVAHQIASVRALAAPPARSGALRLS